ncbi:pheromone/general odorant binding protein [Paenibacillus polymyxa]|uniref:pheromone/general odorant binding protein n=1 Tax=Paenibacillus polymyxa TaxID=1406 RepID=UPI001CD4030E|nr:pheromone/general odorant binding protein [Paenibacillus polymyxa]UBS85428.1 pheromone/general odorant binding protein [Paenibacillus polymyxa]WHX33947.1 pheromone/general odorant binding protein [Paenibacillus polymyxa]
MNEMEEKINRIRKTCKKYETISDSDLRALEKYYLADEDNAKQMSLLGSLIAYVIPLVLLTVNKLLGEGRDWFAISIAAAYFLGVSGTLVAATGLHWRTATNLRAVQLVIEERERLAAASQKQPPAEYPLRRRRYVRQ